MHSARERLGLWVVVSILWALPLVGCVGGDDGPTVEPEQNVEGPWASLSERHCPDDSGLTWENFGEPFMRDWCTGCHSVELPEDSRREAPMGVDMNTHGDVMTYLERIWVRAGDENRTMPPAGGPGAPERALLGEWLACGAPTRAALEAQHP